MTESQFEYLKLLRDSPGWEQMKSYLKKQISGLQIELERTDFEDLSQVARLQGKIQAYRSVLEYPDTRIRQYEKTYNK
mgnify:CR=1 FL=1